MKTHYHLKKNCYVTVGVITLQLVHLLHKIILQPFFIKYIIDISTKYQVTFNKYMNM